jgi:hypothetical protein
MRILVTCLLSALLIMSIHSKQTPIQHININTRSSNQRVTSGLGSQDAKPKESAREVHSDVPEQTTPQTTSSAESETQPVKTVAPTSTEQEAKAFIYQKESGNRPHAQNSIGCYGLGQDCNGQVKDKCGADYACQDAFFTSYMLRRYGTWSAAKSFWLARTPINGRDVGHWW